MNHIIREYTEADIEGIKQCIVDLQDFERMLDSHRLKGIEVAHDYLEHLMSLGKQNRGKVFVVEINKEIVGMISVYIEEDIKQFRKVRKYALISDVIILPEYNDKGIIKELVTKAEEYAVSKKVNTIQTTVLAKHADHIDGFQRNGYHNSEIILRKHLS